MLAITLIEMIHILPDRTQQMLPLEQQLLALTQTFTQAALRLFIVTRQLQFSQLTQQGTQLGEVFRGLYLSGIRLAPL